MENRDRSYFARRSAEERQAASRASHPAAALAHRELARLYRAMARRGTPEAAE